jgi:hypothetical protein
MVTASDRIRRYGQELVPAVARDIANDDGFRGNVWAAQVQRQGHPRRLRQAPSERGNSGQRGSCPAPTALEGGEG